MCASLDDYIVLNVYFSTQSMWNILVPFFSSCKCILVFFYKFCRIFKSAEKLRC